MSLTSCWRRSFLSLTFFLFLFVCESLQQVILLPDINCGPLAGCIQTSPPSPPAPIFFSFSIIDQWSRIWPLTYYLVFSESQGLETTVITFISTTGKDNNDKLMVVNVTTPEAKSASDHWIGRLGQRAQIESKKSGRSRRRACRTGPSELVS